MKIKAILFTFLLGFSVNALAGESPLKEVSALKKPEFSVENKRAIKEDLAKFEKVVNGEFVSNFADEMTFLQSHANLSKDKKYQENTKMRLNNLLKFKVKLDKLSLLTPEVKQLRYEFTQALLLEITAHQRILEVGYQKSESDPNLA